MAEIHDQFDTILILDFGSQVGDDAQLLQASLTSSPTVQPSYYEEMSRAQRLRGVDAVHTKD